MKQICLPCFFNNFACFNCFNNWLYHNAIRVPHLNSGGCQRTAFLVFWVPVKTKNSQGFEPRYHKDSDVINTVTHTADEVGLLRKMRNFYFVWGIFMVPFKMVLHDLHP